MKNEKGITLVELIAALAIVGIITVIIASVLMTGTSSADRTTSKQELQQEANIIVEKIRRSYLDNIPVHEDEGCSIIELDDESEGILKMDNEVISEGYLYSNVTKELCRNIPSEFYLLIEKDNIQFEIKTTFSKLQ